MAAQVSAIILILAGRQIWGWWSLEEESRESVIDEVDNKKVGEWHSTLKDIDTSLWEAYLFI